MAEKCLPNNQPLKLCNEDTSIEIINIKHYQMSPKEETLMKIITYHTKQGDSIIVFCHFIKPLLLLEKYYHSKGQKSYIFHGSLSTGERSINEMEISEKFHCVSLHEMSQRRFKFNTF
jgi:superfamily II DNA/RNA helicase